MNKEKDITPVEEPNHLFQESRLSIDKHDDDSKINNYIRQSLSIPRIISGILPIHK